MTPFQTDFLLLLEFSVLINCTFVRFRKHSNAVDENDYDSGDLHKHKHLPPAVFYFINHKSSFESLKWFCYGRQHCTT